MSFKNYKKGMKRVEDQAIENGRGLFEKVRVPKGKSPPWDWTRRGSWKLEPPRVHPGAAAYYAKVEKPSD